MITFKHPTLGSNGKRWLAALSLAAFTSGHAQHNIPDTPLQVGTTADPNVMMILDDSGSMHFEIMPDDYTPGPNDGTNYVFPRASGIYGSSDYDNYVATVDNHVFNALARSPQINTIYYNPAITYTPWANEDGSLYPNASPTCALHNPTRSGTTSAYCRNLTTDNSNYNSNSWVTCTSTSNSSCSRTTNSKTFWPATYFWYSGSSSSADIWNLANYQRKEIRPTTATYAGEGRTARTDCTAGVCTYTQEIQNFANWYTYYRSRILTARAGIGRAFARQGSALRVGFASINQASSTVDGKSWQSIVRGVRQFSGTNRTTFFSDLYGRSIPAMGTPLRRALDDVGQYYSWTDSRGPWSSTPGVSGGTSFTCRQSYAILMTDGYWNGDAANIATGNQDGSNGSVITGPNAQSGQFISTYPFKDANSDTLADVAAYYWKNDLHSSLGNSVPTSALDPAFWQHMVTFGVGLGVTGSVDPASAFAAIGTSSGTITWNAPTTNAAKIDDLLHAAVNSRGAFFSAKDPQTFATALTGILADIVDRKSSSASVSTNSTKLTTSSLVFSATFNTNKWTGELEAFSVGSNGVATTPKWKASDNIPAAASRKIFTTSGGTAKEFTWANLSTADQGALNDNSDILSFIRGVRSKESNNGGTLRTRGSILGDIVHSSPNYSKDSKLVLVGANDGMLHGFDADTGIEQFAYIPSALIPKLSRLSDPNYQHTYYVDGDIAIGEQSQTFLDRTYAVTTLGRGGKGLFALDITDPANFGAASVKWEYFSSTDKDLGYMLGKPVIAQMNDDSIVAIVGNGYNSTDGRAVLYIINLTTGAVQKITTANTDVGNGLATPGVYDENADGYIDYIYAGDLKGNVWKFNVTSSNSSQWSSNGNRPSVVFVAKDSAGTVQPITSQIVPVKNYVRGDPNLGKLFLFFGTGAYFRTEDPASKAVQTWYAVIDEGSTVSGRSALKQRGISSMFSVDGQTVRTFQSAVVEPQTPYHDMTGKKGWYIDWIDPDGTKRGERIITPSGFYRFEEPVLLVSSIIPVADDPCLPGGNGFVNAVNAFTGGSLSESFFMFGNYNGTAAIGSLDMNLGMVSQASIFVSDPTGQLVVSGSGKSGQTDGSLIGSKTVNTGAQPRGRVSWREIIRK